MGGDGARAHLRRRRLHLPARVLRAARRRRRQLPRDGDGHGPVHRRGRRHRRPRRRAAAVDPSKLRLAFDEWNVWYQERFVGQINLDWQHARPLIEDSFTVVDAVVVGSYLISLLNHADRVAVACQAQLVNIIAPILTEPGGRAWRQTIFHPFAQAARLARGQVLRTLLQSPTYETERYGEVPLLHATATFDDATGDVCLFAVNRSTTDPLPLTADLRGFGPMRSPSTPCSPTTTSQARNTADQPDRVVPRPGRDARLEDRRLAVALPPASWNVLRLVPEPAS